VTRALVGRAAELGRLHRLVTAGRRSSSVRPGIGKSRPAVPDRAAPEFFGVLPDGYYSTPRLPPER
jgi:hypothetical protein